VVMKMIKERTFVAMSEKFQRGIDLANAWMASENVKPINIETINRFTGGDSRDVESTPVGVRIWYIGRE
jgi:hypothetical protein